MSRIFSPIPTKSLIIFLILWNCCWIIFANVAAEPNYQLLAAGRNDRDQLGDGSLESQSFPVQMRIPSKPLKYRHIFAGKDITMFLSEASEAYAVGSNGGRFGDGRKYHTGSTIPVPVDTAGVLRNVILIQAVAASRHSVFLSNEGVAYATGWNNLGQLGDGTTTDRPSPVPVDTSGVLNNVKLIQVSAFGSFSIFLSDEGLAYGTGNNVHGELGDGSETLRISPVAVDTSGVLKNVKLIQISTGNVHTVFLSDRGIAYATGSNGYAQLGDGTNTYRVSPVAVDTSGVLQGVKLIQVSAGMSHTVFLSDEGLAYAVGSGQYGQLGDGSSTGASFPVAVDTSGVLKDVKLIQIAAGWLHTVFLSNEGVAYTTGSNVRAQLGDGTTTNRFSPVVATVSEAMQNETVIQISAANFHSVFLSDTGAAYAVGGNAYGELADGTTEQRNSMVRCNSAWYFKEMIRSVAVGSSNSLFLSDEGHVFGVGKNMWKKDDPPQLRFLRPLPFDFITRQISSNELSTVFLSDEGVAYATGSNNFGQLGDGTTTDRLSPVPVDTSGVLNNVKLIQVSAGMSHTVFLSDEGVAYATGNNEHGELADGTTTERHSPVAVDTSGVLQNATLIQISAGWLHTVFLSDEGVAYATGNNEHGELADGTQTASHFPVAVNTSGVLQNVKLVQVSAGGYHTIFLSDQGAAYASGRNRYGELGDGTTIDGYSPVAVDTSGVLQGVKLIQVSAGVVHSVFLSDEGVAYATGHNYFGQLADGTRVQRILPVAMNNTGYVAFIDARLAYHTVLMANASKSCFHGNYLNQDGACVPCPQGYYCSSVIPKPCPLGEWSSEGSSSLQECSIFLCPEGYTCSNGKKTPCSNGKWRQQVHRTCAVCPRYFACKNATITNCKQPPLYPFDSFRDGQSECALCSDGNFVSTASSPLGEFYLCLPCSVGSACREGYQRQCIGNQFAPSVSSSECQTCPPGSYTNNNSITCNPCPSGHSCGDGIFATPCPSGTYSSNDALSCLPCSAGYYCDGGTQQLCPPGYFSPNGSDSLDNCTQCSVGWSCSNGVKTNCTGNEFTNRAGSSYCLNCPPGRYTGNSGSYCNDCQPGSFCEDGISMTTCQDGTFSSYASTSREDCMSTLCPAGFSCAQGEKMQCSGNTYSDTAGLSSCKNCPVGYFTNGLGRSCEACISSYFCPDGHHLIPCTEANVTEHKLYNCPVCPEGQYLGSEGCAVCTGGFFCDGSNRTACPDGTFSQSGAPGIEHCKSELCSAGNICLQGIMKPCRKNLFANITGLTQCATCAPGGYTNGQGHICIDCSAGSYCPDGVYQYECQGAGYTSQRGMDRCDTCTPGTVSTRGDCSICERGFYCDGASSIPCLHNEYSDKIGLTECKTCPPGRYTIPDSNTQARISCDECSSGHFCNGSMSIACPDQTWTQSGSVATKKSDCRKEYCPDDKICIGGKLEARDRSSEVSRKAWIVGLSISIPTVLIVATVFCCFTLCCILVGIRVFHWRKHVQKESEYTQKLLQNFQQDRELLDLESEGMDQAKLILKQNLMEIDVSEVQIDRKIGSGGSGAIVFAGTWKHETVALKAFRTTDMVGENFFEDFEKEVSLLTSLRHPRIITLYGVSLQPPRVALVMEYCPDSLSSLITSGRMANYSASERLRLLIEVCEGMEYLHDKDVIHRDLKCDNVLISKQGHALITDFGLARQMTMHSQSAMTGHVGTSYYIAPELILQSQNRYSEKCDVFSFSIMAWEVLMGKLNPFDVNDAARLPLLIANNPDYRPSLDLPQFQEGGDYSFVRLILNSCWDRDASRRPSFNDIRQVLKQLQSNTQKKENV